MKETKIREYYKEVRQTFVSGNAKTGSGGLVKAIRKLISTVAHCGSKRMVATDRKFL
jgi:hypothetical protein